MLKSIKLTNFESHIDSTIQLTPGINLITGTSDHGKSAIIRAINWIFFNRPDKDEGFRNENLSSDVEFSASIELDNSTVITRYKTDKENGYRLSTQAEPLKAIRADVPQEIQDLLNVSEVNIQTQHNPYFLLNEKPGPVAAAFNEMVKLSIMDSCVDEAKKEVKFANNAVKSTELELKRVENDLKKTIDTTELEEYYQTAKQLKIEIDKEQNEIDELRELYSTYMSINKEYISLTKCLKKVSSLIKNIDTTHIIIEKETAIRNELSAINKELQYISTTIDTINIPDISLLQKLDTVQQDIEVLSSSYNQLYKLHDDLKNIDTQLVYRKKDLVSRTIEYNKLLEEYDVCPLCDTVLVKK